MHRRILFLAAAAFAAPVLSAEPPAADVAGGQARAETDNSISCRTMRVTGSRLATRRVCMTRVEWALRREQVRQSLDLMQSRGRGAIGIF